MIRAWLFWGEYGFYLGKIFTASKLGDIRLKYRKGVDTIEREYGLHRGKVVPSSQNYDIENGKKLWIA